MGKKKWELRMHEQRELRKRGAEMLHQRVQLLVECYEDKSFQAYCEANEKNELDVLDAELSDVNATFLTLRAVYQRFPNAAEWTNLQQLIATVVAEDRQKRGPSGRISWKEKCLAAEKECERLRNELATMQKALELAGLQRSAA